jgi:hypothetical protein
MNNQISGDAFPQKILKVLQGSAAYCIGAAPGKQKWKIRLGREERS